MTLVTTEPINLVRDTLRFLLPDAQAFWTALAAAGTISAVFLALIPLREQAKLRKVLFSNALAVNVYPDGIFQVENIFDQPITVTKISQALYRGSEFDLVKEDLNKKLKLPVNLKKKIDFDYHHSAAPKQSFIHTRTLTHLPEAAENEIIWIVMTNIEYKNTDGIKNTTKLTHRFSYLLEPRSRWVLEPDRFG